MKDNKTMTQTIEQAFRKLVEPFIKHPKDLEVRVFKQGETVIVEPRAHYADQGKIIGKAKTNFNAVQTILALIGHSNGMHVRLNSLLPAKIGGQEFLVPFDPRDDWEAQETRQDLEEILRLFLKRSFKIKEKIEDDDGKEWTNYEVHISTKEGLPISVGQVAFALSKIFHAIGKHRGRLIKISGHETTA